MGECRIAVLAGDGIGPEVIREAIKVLQATDRRFGIGFVFVDAPVGGAAIDAAGSALPDETLALCRTSRAVLFGAAGGPRWDHLSGEARPERGLLRLRQELAVYANLRPVRVLVPGCSPLRTEVVAGTDFVIVRELTGGLYFGTPRGRSNDQAVDTLRYAREEIARVVRVALQLARARRLGLTSVDKANVLETSRLWRDVVEEEGRAFPDVAVAHMLVDTCAMELVRAPATFDVIVTENMFGDILSDEAAGVVGSLGVMPSASIGDRAPFLYEPVHGSAPDIAGRAIANPVGAILSTAMLLRYSCDHPAAAAAVEGAVAQVLDDGVRTPDLGGSASTSEMGDQIASLVAGSDPVGIGEKRL